MFNTQIHDTLKYKLTYSRTSYPRYC